MFVFCSAFLFCFQFFMNETRKPTTSKVIKQPKLVTMKFAAATTMFASLAASASAFGVRHSAHAGRRAFTTSKSRLGMANVLKLSDPQSQLLDQVDVFIFDCDGVIWRVSSDIIRFCLILDVLWYIFSSILVVLFFMAIGLFPPILK